jgi:membrane protein DedA with SNARE-associated domain
MTGYIIYVIEQVGYAGIAVLMFVENIFPPIPSELIMPLAGFMVRQGSLSFVPTVAAGAFGSVLGAVPYYYLGRRLGKERVIDLVDRYGHWLTISRTDIERALGWFSSHGPLTVLVCRLIPGVRSVISIPAGISGMGMIPFLIYTAIGSGLWTGLLTYGGYVLKDNFEKIEEYIDPASYVIVGALVLLYVYRIITHRGRGEHARQN